MPQQQSGTSAVAAAVLGGGTAEQAELLGPLRAGDRNAFAELVDTWSPMLLRVALLHVSTRASAEEVVQDTWLAVIGQLDRFEGRSSLRTWVFRILENQARSRGVRESRAVPWSSAFGDGGAEDGGPTVDPSRFRGPDDRWPGGWTMAGRPTPWDPPPQAAALPRVGPAPGGRARPRRGAPRAADGARRAARPATDGGRAPRRPRADVGRGLRPARAERGQSADPAAPRARPAACP